MKRRYRLYIIIFLAVSSIGTHAQQRVVSEVRKNINELTVSIDNLKSAINKIKPALLNGDTKDRAETWYVAGCAQYRLYDKYVANRNVGKKVDVKAMGHALIDGFDCYETSLRLDTLREVNKDGSLKIDKKTGLPKWRTKYSKDIIDRYAAHWSDYNRMGGELYNLKDWQGAYQAWDIYCQLAARLEKQRSLAVADSSLAQARFFQGIAKWQQADHRQAVAHFEQARQMGYHKKEAYDYALVCLSSLGDEQAIIATAREAYAMFGVSDLQYARILINDQINKKQYVAADTLLTVAIEARPDDAELQNLKGLVVEQQSGADAALPYYQKCVELAPDNAQGLYNVGRYYYNQAVSAAEQNARLSARALKNKVNPLYQKAMSYLEKSNEIDSKNEDVRNALRNIYYKLGEGKKLEALEKKGK